MSGYNHGYTIVCMYLEWGQANGCSQDVVRGSEDLFPRSILSNLTKKLLRLPLHIYLHSEDSTAVGLALIIDIQ